MNRLLNIGIEVSLTLMLMYLSGVFPIELPGLNLPITLQSMMAILLPLALQRRNAAGGILLYLVLASLGVPILAGNVGGYEYFLSDSGGYLVGFYLMALISAGLKPYIKKPRFIYVFGIFLFQHGILTALGLSWIYLSGSSEIEFKSHVNPFLPGIIVKSFLGVVLYEIIYHIRLTYKLQKT